MILETLPAGFFGTHYGTPREETTKVLALHGWGRNRRDFEHLAETVPLIAVDLPGFGASQPPQVLQGTESYSTQVIELLKSDLFDTPPVVIGHSFGGRVLSKVAAREPDLVKAAVWCGAPLWRDPTTKPAIHKDVKKAKEAHKKGKISASELTEILETHGSEDYRNAKGEMRTVFTQTVNETYDMELLFLRDNDALPKWAVWGTQDTAAPIEDARFIAAAYKFHLVEDKTDHLGILKSVKLAETVQQLVEQ